MRLVLLFATVLYICTYPIFPPPRRRPLGVRPAALRSPFARFPFLPFPFPACHPRAPLPTPPPPAPPSPSPPPLALISLLCSPRSSVFLLHHTLTIASSLQHALRCCELPARPRTSPPATRPRAFSVQPYPASRARSCPATARDNRHSPHRHHCISTAFRHLLALLHLTRHR